MSIRFLRQMGLKNIRWRLIWLRNIIKAHRAKGPLWMTRITRLPKWSEVRTAGEGKVAYGGTHGWSRSSELTRHESSLIASCTRRINKAQTRHSATFLPHKWNILSWRFYILLLQKSDVTVKLWLSAEARPNISPGSRFHPTVDRISTHYLSYPYLSMHFCFVCPSADKPCSLIISSLLISTPFHSTV